MKMILILLGMVIPSAIFAQQNEYLFPSTTGKKTGIDKDIEISKNILETLFQQESALVGTNRVRGIHINGYGVIFTIPGFVNSRVFRVGQRTILGEVKVYDDNAIRESRKERVRADTKYEKLYLDSLREVQEETIITTCKTFLVDYGSLLSGLSKEDKIMVTDRDIDFSNWRYFSRIADTGENTSVEIDYGSILLHKAGKITRDDLWNKVKVVKSNKTENTPKDIELLASIFTRLYKSDLSETYYLLGKTYYEYLENYGVIYQMRMYVNGDYPQPKLVAIQSGQKITPTDSKKREKVESLYPQFKDDLINNMLHYGGTLTSLKPNQNVMFVVQVTDCTGCDVPTKLEVSVKYDVIQKVRNGSLNKDEAIKKMSVIESRK
ncbi:MAG: hypothetical protein AAFN93_08285 [Bacteroidota bacterium]